MVAQLLRHGLYNERQTLISCIPKDFKSDFKQMLEIKKKTVKYLRQILQNIEQYLSNQEYLDSSTSDNF